MHQVPSHSLRQVLILFNSKASLEMSLNFKVLKCMLVIKNTLCCFLDKYPKLWRQRCRWQQRNGRWLLKVGRGMVQEECVCCPSRCNKQLWDHKVLPRKNKGAYKYWGNLSTLPTQPAANGSFECARLSNTRLSKSRIQNENVTLYKKSPFENYLPLSVLKSRIHFTRNGQNSDIVGFL